MTSAIVQKTSKVVGGRDDLINFLWWMKKQNYSEATIRSKSEILQMMLRRGVNLNDGESVKEFIARHKCSPGRKANIIYAYLLYAKWKGIEWAPPRILIPEKLPFIPSEAEINDLIAGTSRYISVFLQIANCIASCIAVLTQDNWATINFIGDHLFKFPDCGIHTTSDINVWRICRVALSTFILYRSCRVVVMDPARHRSMVWATT